MIHCPALTCTCRPSRLMVMRSSLPAGEGGAVPTALSVRVGRATSRTGTERTPTCSLPPASIWPVGSDTGQPPGEPVGRKRAAALPDMGQVLVAEHAQAGGH